MKRNVAALNDYQAAVVTDRGDVSLTLFQEEITDLEGMSGVQPAKSFRIDGGKSLIELRDLLIAANLG
ncbi:hypothetical protein P4H71_26060 [Paenibacillus kribbensis]|uniref:hypothetical protein n=1 Tax=Paenibacillus kribbensis TaxID=172713 RepID=UPI002DBD1B9E|nr:hypothetical protein [Paenibacillus kribbensis]MEC0237786.1 hypothetical protein [Paenibacillus kribbensis]